MDWSFGLGDALFPVFSFGNQLLGGLLGGNAPQAPDYTALVNQMAQANQRNLYAQTLANRPNITTPWGSISWTAPSYNQFANMSGYGGGTGGTGTGPTLADRIRGLVPFLGGGGGLNTTASPTTYGTSANALGASPETAVPSGSPLVNSTAAPSTSFSPLSFGSNLSDILGGAFRSLGGTSTTPTPTAGANPYATPQPNDVLGAPPSTAGAGGGGSNIFGGGFGAGGIAGTVGDVLGGEGLGTALNTPNSSSPWSMTMTLPEEAQRALESQQRLASGRSLAGEGLLGNVVGDLSNYNQFWGELPGMTDPTQARNRAEEALYQRASSRLDPMWSQQQSQLETQLANQGLTPGSTAYDNAMQNFGRSRNDAYQNALNEAIMGGGAEAQRQQQMEMGARQQGISEGYQQQYGGMNALNALLGGQQVGMPSMPGFSGAGMAQTPNYMGAGQAQYQGGLNNFAAGQAQLQNLMSGAAGLAPFFF